ncbi:hypothetical protein [Pedobacter steynii]
MNKYIFSLSIPFMLMLTNVSAQETTIKQVQWCTAAKLQNADGSTSLGFAGAVNAVFNDALMVAGELIFLIKCHGKEARSIILTGSRY